MASEKQLKARLKFAEMAEKAKKLADKENIPYKQALKKVYKKS